jgi:hypothetical protein
MLEKAYEFKGLNEKLNQWQIVNIPYNVKMNVNNFDEDVLEIFVIKSPNPRYYGGK